MKDSFYKKRDLKNLEHFQAPPLNYLSNKNLTIMKRILLLISILVPIIAFAQQKVTIKAGTMISLQADKTVKAADVSEGETVNFRTTADVNVDGIKVIERGTIVKGRVVEARKSTVLGTKGRLVINITHLNLADGTPLYFTDSYVRVYGKNKTPLSVIVACFVWPGIFICGTKAVMPEGYEATATVASNTEITINK